MSESRTPARDSASAASARHEPIISRFESAWVRGERPSIDDFLPPDDPDCRALLLTLVRAELGCRLEAGEPACVEDYLGRYAELAEDRGAVLSLIRVEREGRARRGSAITTEEFERRFARYLATPTAGPAVGPGPVATRPPAVAETIDDGARTVSYVGGEPAPAARPALPAVPGFEVLGVLGRGGMGVVYQARQVSLKRVVALKMISAGGSPGPDEVARFRIEAEAAARLQHPNIVQIHEVGTCGLDGGECPYMALEFVEGGSLARMAGRRPLPPDRAAELVVLLARAMHHAHERGVVHRDLKPANVLLTADGTPKITDFGLAKQLEGDSGRTASGAVMGTPSYMAPEQAEGRTKDIGPLTDVYALGALLYELLTGRPPFVGASVIETLEQVRSREPLPPRALNPKVPRDLETVCLKCLSKEPARRYAGARELAEDLERFRAGESVRARREGPLGKVWRRVRRRPRLVGAVGAGVLALAVLAGLALHFRTGSRVTALRQPVISAREVADDSEQSVAEVERLIDELARVSPDAAAAERELLYERLEEVIGGRIRKGRLEDDELAAIRASLDRLAARSEGRAKKLRADLDARLRDWIDVFRVEGPEFAEREAVFGPGGGDVREGALEARPAPGAPSPDLALTLRPSPGNAQLTAVFAHPGWESAARVGVALGASRSRGGYAFVLSGGRRADGGPRSLGEACRLKAPLSLQILRNGRVMRERDVSPGDVAGRPLTLWGQRRGDGLRCQVNGRQPLLAFRDPFSIGAGEGGAFAVVAPAGARLSRLVAERLSEAIAPRPLERGDELFDQGRFEEAADFYRKEALAAGPGEVGQEARYKAGRCLLELGREEDAARLFEEVASGDGPQWPALADCQLWARALDQKGVAARARALEVRQRLTARGLPPEQFAPLLPDELRGRLLRAGDAPPLSRLLAPPDDALIERHRDAFTFLRLVEADRHKVGGVGLSLIKAHRLAGQEDAALRVGQDLLREYTTLDGGDIPRQVLEQVTWMLRLRGSAGDALIAAQRLMDGTGDPEGASDLARPALLDRARSRAAKDPALAEQDVDRVLAKCEGLPAQPVHAVDAWLLKGFLRERAGRNGEAVAAWRRGVASYKASPARHGDAGTLSIVLDYSIMAALGDSLDDEAAAELRRRLLSEFASDAAPAALISLVAEQQPLDVYRRMWKAERGRKIAGQIAFREVTYADAFRLPLFLNVATTLHLMTLAGDPTPEQEQLVWDLVRTAYAAFVAKKVSNSQLAQLALAFVSASAKAPDVKLPDDAALRGPIAYVFGLRYLKKGNAKEAEPFFAEALKAAPPEAPLRRLAAKELEGIKGR